MIEILNSIRKYNFWNSNVVDFGYQRLSYTDKIGKYVVSIDDYKISTNEGIEHIPAWELDSLL